MAQNQIKVRALIRTLKLNPASLEQARMDAKAYYENKYDDFSGYVSDKALCSFLRHRYTNYEALMNSIEKMVGQNEFYENIKVYLCCQIVRYYSLKVDPLYAAFGEAATYKQIPDRFRLPQGKNLESTVWNMIND